MRPTILIFLLLFLSVAVGQQKDAVDFTEGHIRIEVIPDSSLIKGNVVYDFLVNRPADSIVISSRGLEITQIRLGKDELAYAQKGNQIIIPRSWERGSYKGLTIVYRAQPKQAVYFPGWHLNEQLLDDAALAREGGRQVWTQGQGKYSSSWVPSFDDMNEKVKFSLDIIFPSGYTVLANGKLTGTQDFTGKTLWKYRIKHPVSSYLLAFVAGHYDKKTVRTSSGVTVELYYYPDDRSRVASTYQHTREIFDYLEEEIGVKYPWANYKQVPVRDFLYAGMENVGVTVFSDTYMTDSIGVADKSYVNVNAHELAHHWFGNMVTEENGKHHWLQEGFATYYALLAERHLLGDDHYYWKLYDSFSKLSALSETGKGEALLDPGAGSITFYEKGAWALHMLKERTGEKAFRAGVKKLLTTHAFSNITTEDLISSMVMYTDADLEEFQKVWLESQEFPVEEALESLRKNEFIRRYTDCVSDNSPAVVLYNEYVGLLKEGIYYPLKHYVLKRAASWPGGLRDSLWNVALRAGDLKTRQGVALAADSISVHLKPGFETLLDDASYLTVQEALLKLWMAFPEDRERYLRSTAHLQGFEDKALRVLWLGLALFTPEFSEEAPDLFRELTSYTSPVYQFEVRQQAMNMLYQTGGFTRRSLRYLLEGTGHPAWQFSRFSKHMLDSLLVQQEARIQLRALLPELGEEEQSKLRMRLKNLDTDSGQSQPPRP